MDRVKENNEKILSSLHECCLFLNKNNAFPLQNPCKIALFGGGARHTIKGGTGSGDVNVDHVVTIEEGLIKAGFVMSSNEWLDRYDSLLSEYRKEYVKDVKKSAKEKHVSVYMEAFGFVKKEKEYDIPLSFEGDAAIYVVSRISGEGNDRLEEKGDIYLTDSEIRDILSLNEKFEKFMLVLNVGGVINLSPVKDVNNILLLSQLGKNIGDVFASILLGKANPSGKLSTTWASYLDYPLSTRTIDINDTNYTESIYVGYRYFDSYNIKPLFPFGYGKSYSEFEISNPKVVLNGRAVNVTCTVKNTSPYVGKEVVQLYVSEPQGKLGKVYQRLISYKKSNNILPNSEEELVISFDFLSLASFSVEQSAYVLEKGNYILRLGNSSKDTVVIGAISLKEDFIVKKVKLIYKDTPTPSIKELKDEEVEKTIPFDHIVTIGEVNYPEPRIAKDINKYSDNELISLLIGSQRGDGLSSFVGESPMRVKGAAGESSNEVDDFKPYVMSDGPAGLRLSMKVGVNDKGKLRDLSANPFMIQLFDFFPFTVRPFIKKLTKEKTLKKNEHLLLQECSSLPIGTALAQSWNDEYAYLLGDVVGKDMEDLHVDYWLAPGMNIHRSIRCGRNFEYYSEDPLLTGNIAANITRGVQSHKNKYVTLKHFACNNIETNRFFNNSVVDERALREIYLSGFEIAIKQSLPGAIMSSYNLINGKHSNATKELIYDYLRYECGFTGIVMTDWVLQSNSPLSGSKYSCSDIVDTIKAGSQIFMPGSDYHLKEIKNAFKKGKLTRYDLEVAASPFVDFHR